MPEVECTQCGKIHRRPSQVIEKNDNHFCGRECYKEYKSIHGYKKTSARRHWSGGFTAITLREGCAFKRLRSESGMRFQAHGSSAMGRPRPSYYTANENSLGRTPC